MTNPSFESKGYISLKLSRQFDVVKLRNMINDLIDGDNAIGISMNWADLAEILLKVDGSWDKRPEFYHKYDIVKHKEANLERNQMTLNENLNILEDSYIHSMDRIVKSLENILRRTRKLENTLQKLLLKYSECEDSTIHKSFYLRLLRFLGTNEYCKYLSKDKQCLKGSPCDKDFSGSVNCPAVIRLKDSEGNLPD